LLFIEFEFHLPSLWRPLPFCYECGRSLNVTLTPCSQCKQALLC